MDVSGGLCDKEREREYKTSKVGNLLSRLPVSGWRTQPTADVGQTVREKVSSTSKGTRPLSSLPS